MSNIKAGQGLKPARLLAAAALGLALTFAAVAPPSLAQVNPTANAVKEEQLLQQLKRVDGRITIPDQRAATLINPEGRAFSSWHSGNYATIAAAAILGMLALLVLFYFAKGPVKISGGRSGQTIMRFNAFERMIHWMTGLSFLVLGGTGLNIAFGRKVLLPILGDKPFHILSEVGKTLHNYVAFAFMVGLVLMFLVWVKDNFPHKTDGVWLSRFGGFLDGTHPPAKRFNAGQKLIFWSVILGGAALSVSGLYMLFPFQWTDMAGMQLAILVHGLVAVALVAVMLAHIYIGSVGMEGAIDAMKDGEVDLNWAKEHHSLWVAEEQARKGAKVQPAE